MELFTYRFPAANDTLHASDSQPKAICYYPAYHTGHHLGPGGSQPPHYRLRKCSCCWSVQTCLLLATEVRHLEGPGFLCLKRKRRGYYQIASEEGVVHRKTKTKSGLHGWNFLLHHCPWPQILPDLWEGKGTRDWVQSPMANDFINPCLGNETSKNPLGSKIQKASELNRSEVLSGWCTQTGHGDVYPL